MMLQEQEFTIFREVIDSEIAEVVMPGSSEETSVGEVLRALLFALAQPKPTKSIDSALHAARVDSLGG